MKKTKINRWNEFLCILFGHKWDRRDMKCCERHNHWYTYLDKCSRCKLVKLKEEDCQVCREELQARLYLDNLSVNEEVPLI